MPETMNKGKEEQRFSQEYSPSFDSVLTRKPHERHRSLPRAIPEVVQDRRPAIAPEKGRFSNAEASAPAARATVQETRRVGADEVLTSSQEFDPAKYAASSPNLPDTCTMM